MDEHELSIALEGTEFDSDFALQLCRDLNSNVGRAALQTSEAPPGAKATDVYLQAIGLILSSNAVVALVGVLKSCAIRARGLKIVVKGRRGELSIQADKAEDAEMLLPLVRQLLEPEPTPILGQRADDA